RDEPEANAVRAAEPALLDIEARRSKAFEKIASIATAVIGPPVMEAPFGAIERLLILIGGAPPVDHRHQGEEPSAPSDDPEQLRDGGAVVNMLEHVRTDDRVERRIGKIDTLDIELKVDSWFHEVGRLILADHRAQEARHRFLRREVEQRVSL